MKFNKPKIEEIKNTISSLKNKLTSKSKQKVPKKYYTLLVLMILLGTITLYGNIKQYNNSKKEEYKEYKLEEKEADSSNIETQRYETAESSISTNVSNIVQDYEAIETISSNKKNNYIMPVEGEIIKEFAIDKLIYSETLGMWKTHPGIDIKADINTQVKSSSFGTVLCIEKNNFYGNTVKIVDSNGYTLVYSNLDNDIHVCEGDKVDQGAIIGTVGISAAGELQEKTHLHFEVIKDGVQVNPLDLIN